MLPRVRVSPMHQWICHYLSLLTKFNILHHIDCLFIDFSPLSNSYHYQPRPRKHVQCVFPVSRSTLFTPTFVYLTHDACKEKILTNRKDRFKELWFSLCSEPNSANTWLLIGEKYFCNLYLNYHMLQYAG